ncbi:hypothetical protein L208DRAFT_510765 [Tricholoma matsutake]|nr:hypothetical protein L208DRAFT_1516087 [Tricholoma matsutake 945]KAF8240618.1 hypothetical protein L208DRAFT_510765 [Tricholoma matsutake 945]
MAKSKKQPSEFTASSTRYCDSCKIDVKIGFGGEANWTSHTESAAHRKNEAANSVSSNSKLTSFFKRKPPESTAMPKPSVLPSSLRNPAFFSSQACPLPVSPIVRRGD